MFGYVRIYKPELKMGEYEQYEGVYCALCRQLGRRYGLLARFTLSYDLAFLALFRMALDDECAGFSKARCTFNPLKKCTFCGQSAHVDAAADTAAILTYYKLRDNIADEPFFASLPARLAYPFAALARRKAGKRRPELEERVARCMAEQAAVEGEQAASIDRAAEPFALPLSGLAAEPAHTESERRVLERFGYCLGRWIYLIDAADDLDEDEKKGRYNPYRLMAPPQADAAPPEEPAGRRDYALLTLNACLAECVAAYHLLTIRRFDGILLNILELGLPAAQKQVVHGQSKKGKKKHEQRSV